MMIHDLTWQLMVVLVSVATSHQITRFMMQRTLVSRIKNAVGGELM